jgi:hypothetical protein
MKQNKREDKKQKKNESQPAMPLTLQKPAVTTDMYHEI